MSSTPKLCSMCGHPLDSSEDGTDVETTLKSLEADADGMFRLPLEYIKRTRDLIKALRGERDASQARLDTLQNQYHELRTQFDEVRQTLTLTQYNNSGSRVSSADAISTDPGENFNRVEQLTESSRDKSQEDRRSATRCRLSAKSLQKRNSDIERIANEFTLLQEILQRKNYEYDSLQVQMKVRLNSAQERIAQLKDTARHRDGDLHRYQEQLRRLESNLEAEREQHLDVEKMLIRARGETDVLKSIISQLQSEIKMIKRERHKLRKEVITQRTSKLQAQDKNFSAILEVSPRVRPDSGNEFHTPGIQATQAEMKLVQRVQEMKYEHKEETLRLRRQVVELQTQEESLRSEIGSLRRELGAGRNGSGTLREELEKYKKEMEHMTEIIRVNTDQRFQLSEALAKAKKEILLLKPGPQGGNLKPSYRLEALSKPTSDFKDFKRQNIKPSRSFHFDRDLYNFRKADRNLLNKKLSSSMGNLSHATLVDLTEIKKKLSDGT